MQLFDLLSLFYAFLGVRAISTAIKQWRAFTDDQLTAFDRRLAGELAFFVLVPLGVFLHELGHAAATYQVGGRINWLGGGFHYALFYGYVIPLGRFSEFQEWWIALAGNLVSVIYGFLPLILLRFIPLRSAHVHRTACVAVQVSGTGANRGWLKYMLLAFARIQLGWSLVGYPLITFAGFEGDWKTIYFTTPFLGIPVFVSQAALVIALWLIDHSAFVKRWEVSLYAGAREQLQLLDGAIRAQPGVVDPILSRGNFFAANAHPELAIADYRAALKLDPQNPRALYNIGQLKLIQRNFTQAEQNFRAALARADSDREIAGRVHYGLAMSLFHLRKADEAIREFDAAIARVPDVPEFYFWRGTVRRSQRDDANARNDFARTAELARVSDPDLAARAREMLVNSKQ